jgi:inorganic triphosphatase YgiF
MKRADREIELKFSCGPEDLVAVLAAAPAGDDQTRELISVYFDTADRALQKAGASLRVREHKGRRTQTLKRGHGLVREEHEAAIDGLAPDPALGPLPSMLPDGATLKPAFNVRVSRRQRTFRYQGAKIELALDQGEVFGGERRSPICEVELELKSGPPAALFALARELSKAAPLYLAFDSKAARGQALVTEGHEARRSDKVDLAGDGTVGEAFQAIARQALSQIAANAAALRLRPELEAIHQLRVGARRLRSALSTFKPVLEGDGLAELSAGLRWLSHACDTARNLDVFSDETLKPAEGENGAPGGLGALREAVDAACVAARAAAVEAAASERFRLLLIDATAWAETGAWRDGPDAATPISAFAGQALKRHLKKLAKAGRAARDGDDTARHQLRIEAKKLRYAAEALGGLYGEKRTNRYLHEIRDLQEKLGALNDLATAEPLVAALRLSPEAAFAAGELIGLKAARKPRLIAQSFKALDRLEAMPPFWG